LSEHRTDWFYFAVPRALDRRLAGRAPHREYICEGFERICKAKRSGR
jgi:hypothetical protein